ncbi:uncharacterized protein IUM83_02919 [Phytophthora cinnamomi]|uniref:uncharacterized protein n=1 Tax=Phytophthora cinnamomi TaxID=4785 RepID=UPI00355AB8DD|nr:hypothetical protein IUM83_02919 [Phytophthora cinnamomi]
MHSDDALARIESGKMSAVITHTSGPSVTPNTITYSAVNTMDSADTSTMNATVIPMDITTMPDRPHRIMLRAPKRLASTPVKKAGQMLMKSMMSVPTRESEIPASEKMLPE